MGLQDAVRICFQKYVTISGRARRAEYWWWILFLVLGGIVAGILDGFIFGFSEGSTQILAAIFSLGSSCPRSASRSPPPRPGHVGVVAAPRSDSDHRRDHPVFFYVTRGTPGPNRFGPDPLGPTGSNGRSPNVWDQPDDSFARSSVPRAGRKE